MEVHIVADKRITKLRDIVTGAELTGEQQAGGTIFATKLERASYRVFAAVK